MSIMSETLKALAQDMKGKEVLEIQVKVLHEKELRGESKRMMDTGVRHLTLQVRYKDAGSKP